MTVLLAPPAALAYLISGLLIGLRLFSRDRQKRPPRALALGIAWVALVLHALVLYDSVVVPTGLNLAFFNALSLLAWIVAALLLASSIGKPVDNLGILLMPVTALSLVLAWRYPSVRLLEPGAGLPLAAHVLLSLLAYGMLTLASVQAILLAVQDHHLRRHHPGGFVRALPPLQSMETLLFQMIAVGFVLLTFALLSGFTYLEDMFAQHLVHKTLLSIIAWVVFFVLLWGRYRYGWRGRTALRWTLGGFAMLMLAYFGSKAVLELILQR
ncbi:MAG: cytochrome c biogenesis protein CcsA [Pseudomonadota bacterium]